MQEQTVCEPNGEMPIRGHYDVVVCGGGPAGCAAAVAAGRCGARTLLVERYTHLGGMATGARVHGFCDSPGGPIFDEMIERLLALDAADLQVNKERFRDPGRYGTKPEMLKALLMEMADEAGVEVLLDSVACGAVMRGRRVTGVRVANKAGLGALLAPAVIDATADADIAAAAGARFLQGDETDGRIQHCNFRWAMGGVDWKRFQAERPPDDALIEKLRAANRNGHLKAPSAIFQRDPAIFPWNGRTRSLGLSGGISWELHHVDSTNPVQTSRVVAECQRAAIAIVRWCRKELPGFENCSIESIASALGTRESRRIVGRYQVTRADVLAGVKHPDAVARAWFWLDLHDPPPGKSIPYALDYIKANQPPPGDWYEIPYRSLLPEAVEGLIVAGRCISCDRPAQGSLRVMPTCMFVGTGAGVAAAAAARLGCAPHEVPFRFEMMNCLQAEAKHR